MALLKRWTLNAPPSLQGWIKGGGRGGGGGQAPPPNPENQFENRAKFLCLKGKGRTISLFMHQKCFNVNSSGHKEPHFNHLMLVDANCDNSKVPKPGCGLESECGTEKKKKNSPAYACILGTPLFQILDPTLLLCLVQFVLHVMTDNTRLI